VIGRGTFGGLWGIILLSLLLGGCSVMGSLHVGDVTVGLQNDIATMGSHVGIFLH
jgi:hypothetical protein